MSALLPCPFCSGLAVTDFIEGESYIIECNACEARTGSKDCPGAAIEAWNRRAIAQTDVSGVIDAARRLISAKGRFHTEQNYKALADAVSKLDAAIAAKEKA